MLHTIIVSELTTLNLLLYDFVVTLKISIQISFTESKISTIYRTRGAILIRTEMIARCTMEMNTGIQKQQQ